MLKRGSALLAFLCLALPLSAQRAPRILDKSNLVAWCVVPFDAKQRGPVERAQMLKRLGITRLAYDWRDKDIPTFDQELDALNEHGIKLHAFWFPFGLEPAKDKNVRVILDFLERRKVKTELWASLSGGKAFEALSESGKLEAAVRAVGWVAAEAGRIGCPVALYNHGGWYGEPENQIAIIRRVKARNLGIVYNFHHGHGHIERFGELIGKMRPYLMAVNLNGMRKEGPMILPLGEGDRELAMIQALVRSGYRGPVGILNHRTEVDAEVGLRQNLDGLRALAGKLGR